MKNKIFKKMPKLCKKCPHGHRASSNSQKKCHVCGYRFYKRRYSPITKLTKKCPLCQTRVGGNNTKTCKKCGHIFKKSKKKLDQQVEKDIDWFLDELVKEIKTGVTV